MDAQDERAGTTALRPDSAHRDALRTRGAKAAGMMARMAAWTDVDDAAQTREDSLYGAGAGAGGVQDAEPAPGSLAANTAAAAAPDGEAS